MLLEQSIFFSLAKRQFYLGVNCYFSYEILKANPLQLKNPLYFFFVPSYFWKFFLANPKTKLFVSHCDAMEIFDALFFGIPTLCVRRKDPPRWSDRVSSRSLEQVGIALETDIATDDEKAIANKLRKLLSEKRYNNRKIW